LKFLGKKGDIKGKIKNGLRLASLNIEKILENKENIEVLAKKYMDRENAFFIGRNLDYGVSLEGSLKLKEISYIHSEAYPAGELKHGAIALVEPASLVLAVVTQENMLGKMISNIKEVKARGGNILCVAKIGFSELEEICDDVLFVPEIYEILEPLLSVIPLQLFAYYTAKLKGLDIDKPRNLAKSVTVE
jgi:glucosamine--fructose-6-phosphate aminotransferase (isomerizing)